MTRPALTSLSLCGLCAAVVTYIVTGAQTFALIGALFYGLFLFVGTEYLRLRERYLIALSVISAVIAISIVPKPLFLLSEASIRAAYLAAFFLMLSVLRDGAMTSSSVLQVGRYLIQQPPNRRYWALAVGGHAMGVVMNFGALILLAPLVQRGAKDVSGMLSPEIIAIREQRQLTALTRGFSWFIAWAPTSIAQVVAVTIVTGASHVTVALFGALAAALVIIAGWIEDWFFGAKLRKRLGAPTTATTTAPLPTDAFFRLGSVYAVLIAVSVLIAYGLKTRLVDGVILAALPVTVLWITMQMRAGRGDGRGLVSRARDFALTTLPKSSPEASTLALAGFTGTVLAGVVPPEALTSVFALFGSHTTFLYIAITATVVLFSLIAMPPMLTVTFLGAAASRAEGVPLDPNLLALALVFGWAINLTASPFGGSNLILSRQTGVPVSTLAFDWNARFSIAAFIICAILLAVAA